MSGAGYGSTGANRDTAGLNAGTSGSKAMGDRAGTGEVRSGMHSGGRDEYSGIAFAGSSQQQGEGGVRERVAGAARGAADTVRDKAGDATSGARGRLGGLSDRANQLLESRGLLGRLEENPLPALGVAFAIGFLVAGGTNAGSRPNSPAARARAELRNALMAGLSTGMSQGARGFMDTAARPEGVANSLLRTVLSSVLGAAGQEGQGGQQRQGGGQQGGQRSSQGATAGRSTAGQQGGAGRSQGGRGQY